MRLLSKPSTARCTLPIYVLYLLSEPQWVSCVRLAEILEDVSHDSINRFLVREAYTPQDLYAQVSGHITLIGGTLSADDTVIDKPYRDPKLTELVDWFWSGKHKRPVKGLNIITLYYTDIHGCSVPVNYRVVNKAEGRTKNEYFREMLEELLCWGLCPAVITGDSWYSSGDNLKRIKDHQLGVVMGIERNRLVSVEKGTWRHVESLEIPQDGLMVYLKGFGRVKVFRTVFKNEFRYYLLHWPTAQQMAEADRTQFKQIHDCHWGIECFHRAIKQVCNVERFHVRDTQAILNHIFCSFWGFVQLELQRFRGEIINWYQPRRELFNELLRDFILNTSLEQIDMPNQYAPSVNA